MFISLKIATSLSNIVFRLEEFNTFDELFLLLLINILFSKMIFQYIKIRYEEYTMREKSDINKILEGRCQKLGIDYVGMKKANESHSFGSATQIYDPIANRTVDTLSTGEKYFFWLLRFDDDVVEIYEQMLMLPKVVAKVAVENNLHKPKNLLSTDFVVRYKDGTIKAYSIKESRNAFKKSCCKSENTWKRNIRRQILEKRYWEALEIEWELVFSEELNRHKAENISAVMKFYNQCDVTTLDHMYRYLIAHKIILVDMEKHIPFAKIANKYELEIRKIYEEAKHDTKY